MTQVVIENPIPAAKKRGKRLAFDTEWTRDRVEESKVINHYDDGVLKVYDIEPH